VVWHNSRVDPEVLLRFSAGDEDAVKSVYERYGGAVYTVAMNILRDPGRAVDATQETFFKAWKGCATYDPRRPFGPWIYAIARRAALDIYRRERRQVPSEDVDVIALPTPLESVWVMFEVRAAVDLLADDEREVVRMSHFDGLTHVEIAERLDIPLGTVKSRSHRAHAHLAELLRHVEEE
jgi:RNA polymerase sigma-70 factor, ECF subfamily